MDRVKFSAGSPDLSLVRQVVFQRLRDETDGNRSWRQLEDDNGHGFERYVEFPFSAHGAAEAFTMALIDVFWELVSEGVIAPGLNASNRNLPWFHLTAYGRKVIANAEYQPHDRSGYVARLRARVAHVDPTVAAYIEESLDTFARGSLVASMVMLGVAAERVFDLVCESLTSALRSDKERANLSADIRRTRLRPKIERVQRKFQQLQDDQAPGFPENATLMVVAMYDLIRAQRNDLGHPRDQPPRLGRDEANARLQIFGSYYETAEASRTFLAATKV